MHFTMGTCAHVGEVVCVRPRGVLAGSVRDYSGYREHLTGTVSRREFASSAVLVNLTFGDPITVVRAQGDGAGTYRESLVTGPRDTSAETLIGGRQHGVQLALSPLDAYSITGTPIRLLSNNFLDVTTLFGRPGSELIERLAEQPSWAERFRLLDEALTNLRNKGPRPDPVVASAWRALARTSGAVRVATLACELGVSRRHLVRRFTEQAGLPPKTVARIMRFERAITLLHKGEPATFARIAAEAGYSDQAHLSREIKAFTEGTPSQFAGNRTGSGFAKAA
ncbi:helix-turn-helix domain-containing protein [Saccharomonospora sp. NPDC006951]